ncbi:MAG: hybrid sensor histidine kinase/response regulator [Comamonadaceae bacterium]|nr:hybrid sensor histidine kinase/response regulator [Comamonadaceae bacterium]
MFEAEAVNSPRSSVLRYLEATVVLALLLPTVFLALEARLRYTEAVEQARARLSSDVQVAAQHALRVFDTTDVLLQRSFELIGDSGDAALRSREEELHNQLKRMTAPLTHVQSMWIFDRFGRALTGNRSFPVPDLNVWDREYFQWHREGRGRTFVTEALVARVGGEHFFDVSRRRVDTSGNFDGLISVGLRPQHFSEFYKELAGNRKNARFVLLRSDGRIVARWPSLPAPEARLPADYPMLSRWVAGETAGTYDGDSWLDGTARLGAFRKVDGYPLYIYASMPRQAVLTAWQREMTSLAAFVLPGSLLLAWMAWLARKRTREQLLASQQLEKETAHRQRIEESLRQAQKLEAMGRLTGGVAHDFNNLLAVVGNNAFLLKRDDLSRETQAVAVARIERAVDSGTALTRQLLSFTRHQALRPEVVSLQQRLPVIADMLRTALGSRIECVVSVEPDTALIEVDVAELELALLNLVVNAKDASPNGGRVTIQAYNGVADDHAELGRPSVVIEVADTGEGIEPGVLERAFEPFFTTKTVGKGTGLGLSQVYGFCTRAQGTARIDSVPGRGTKVRLCLPAALHAAAPITQAANMQPGPLRCRVLVVDDNEALAQSIKTMLESTDSTVTVAATAEQALAMLTAGSAFDVILSDLVMPGPIDGIGLAEAVRRTYPELPVVLMTGYSDQLVRARRQGFTVLPKPSSPQVLVQTLSWKLQERIAQDGSGQNQGQKAEQ